MSQANQPLTLYRFFLSGHSHRIELFLSLLGLRVELVDVDLKTAQHKTPEFLRLNPFGQVPVLVEKRDDSDVVLADSNAILVYLAKKYGGKSWLPDDALQAAHIERWLSVAAGPLAAGPAAARRINVFGAKLNAAEVQASSHALLRVMNNALAQTPFLVGNQPTIADIANYTYVAHAPEGDVSLKDYLNIKAWLARIEKLPGFVPMQKTAVGCAE
jgi:glutathione S-transferase